MNLRTRNLIWFIILMCFRGLLNAAEPFINPIDSLYATINFNQPANRFFSITELKDTTLHQDWPGSSYSILLGQQNGFYTQILICDTLSNDTLSVYNLNNLGNRVQIKSFCFNPYRNSFVGSVEMEDSVIQGINYEYLFEFMPDRNAFTKLVNLSSTDIFRVNRTFYFTIHNEIYGTSAFGGKNGKGTIFKYSLSTAELTIDDDLVNVKYLNDELVVLDARENALP